MLPDRAAHENPADMDYLFMDHAYFSGLFLAKALVDLPDVMQKSRN